MTYERSMENFTPGFEETTNSTDLYSILCKDRNPDRLEHWLEFNQLDFVVWFDAIKLMSMPDYETEDCIE